MRQRRKITYDGNKTQHDREKNKNDEDRWTDDIEFLLLGKMSSKSDRDKIGK